MGDEPASEAIVLAGMAKGWIDRLCQAEGKPVKKRFRSYPIDFSGIGVAGPRGKLDPRWPDIQ